MILEYAWVLSFRKLHQILDTGFWPIEWIDKLTENALLGKSG